MTIHAIKLTDSTTTVELDTDTGEITERGKAFPVLHRPVEDTWELFKLPVSTQAGHTMRLPEK